MAGKGPSLGGGNESVDLGSSDGGAEQQGTHHEAGDLAARQTFHLSSMCSLPLSCCTVGRGTELLGGEPARGRERLTLRVGGGRGQPCQPAVTQCRTPPNCRLEDEAVDRGSGSVGLVKITS